MALKHVYDVFHISLLKPFHSGGYGQDAPTPILVDDKVEYKVIQLWGIGLLGEFTSIWFLLLGISCLRHYG